MALQLSRRAAFTTRTSVAPGRGAAVVPAAARKQAFNAEAALKSASAAALGAVVASGVLLSSVMPAFSADLELGEQVFNGNCAACHQGGNNSVIPGHGLHKAEIEQFLTGGYNLNAIVYQVTNGKGAMPAWGDRLDEDEIQAVSEYVFNKAETDSWE